MQQCEPVFTRTNPKYRTIQMSDISSLETYNTAMENHDELAFDDIGELPLWTNTCTNPGYAINLAERLMDLYPTPEGNRDLHRIFVSPTYKRLWADNFFKFMCQANIWQNEGHLVLFARFLRVRFGVRIGELSIALHPMLFEPMRDQCRFKGFCTLCLATAQRDYENGRPNFFSPIARNRTIPVNFASEVVPYMRPRRLFMQARAQTAAESTSEVAIAGETEEEESQTTTVDSFI